MTVLLVDANNVAMRALHAMGRTGLSGEGGVATGPVLGFINSLSKHIKEEQPRAVAVCWDGGRSKRRTDLSPEYKAHRLDGPEHVESAKTDAFALAKEFCTLAGLYHVERPGIEADDLIAHYWRQRDPNERLVILSSDKDFLQLVEGNVEQVRLSSAGTPTDRWTEERVREEYGCPSRWLTNALALAGDASDNVIGVPRVGMKTAIKLLSKHRGSMAEVLTEDPKVMGFADQVLLNLDLVDLRTGLDRELVLPALPSFSPTTPGSLQYEALLSFFVGHQMKSVQSRFFDGSLWR